RARPLRPMVADPTPVADRGGTLARAKHESPASLVENEAALVERLLEAPERAGIVKGDRGPPRRQRIDLERLDSRHIHQPSANLLPVLEALKLHHRHDIARHFAARGFGGWGRLHALLVPDLARGRLAGLDRLPTVFDHGEGKRRAGALRRADIAGDRLALPVVQRAGTVRAN